MKPIEVTVKGWAEAYSRCMFRAVNKAKVVTNERTQHKGGEAKTEIQ